MNKNVYSASLFLCVLFILTSYVLKFIIPEMFILDLEAISGTWFSEMMNKNRLFNYVVSLLNNLALMCAFTKACIGKQKIKPYIYVLIFANHFIMYNGYVINYICAILFSSATMIFIGKKSGANIKNVLFVFFLHLFLQKITLEVRGLSESSIYLDDICVMYLGAETYIWLIFLYLIKSKETGGETFWELCTHHFMVKKKKKSNQKWQNARKSLMKKSWNLQHTMLSYKKCKKIDYETMGIADRIDFLSAIHKYERLKGGALSLSVIILFLVLGVMVSGKPIEVLYFCISHTLIRMKFEKQYHASTVDCTRITMFVIFVGIIYTMPMPISLLSSIPLSLAISWVGYIAKDRIDVIQEYELLKREKELYRPSKREILQEKFKEYRVKIKYREYLLQALCDGIKDSEFFDSHPDIVDTQQYRNYKCKFLKKIQ